MTNLLPCPFCGSEKINIGAFGVSPDCYVECEECGATIESEVPWGELSTEEHDQACYKHLSKLWNRRSNGGENDNKRGIADYKRK